MKSHSFLLFLFILVLIQGCDPVDDRLTIINQSDKKIYYTTNSHSQLNKLYKESSINVTYLNYVGEIEVNISKNERMMGPRGKAWENYVRNICEDGKLRVYTFSIDTLKKYSFRDIIDNNRYLEKREFTVDDLEKINWRIVYK